MPKGRLHGKEFVRTVGVLVTYFVHRFLPDAIDPRPWTADHVRRLF